MMILTGSTAGCAPELVASDDALVIGLRQPIDRLNVAVVAGHLPQIRSAAREVIAIYDAAAGPR